MVQQAVPRTCRGQPCSFCLCRPALSLFVSSALFESRTSCPSFVSTPRQSPHAPVADGVRVDSGCAEALVSAASEAQGAGAAIEPNAERRCTWRTRWRWRRRHPTGCCSSRSRQPPRAAVGSTLVVDTLASGTAHVGRWACDEEPTQAAPECAAAPRVRRLHSFALKFGRSLRPAPPRGRAPPRREAAASAAGRRRRMHERRGSSRAPRADVVRSEQSARRQEQPDTPRRLGSSSSSSGGNESRAADAGDHSAATDRAATAGVGAGMRGEGGRPFGAAVERRRAERRVRRLALGVGHRHVTSPSAWHACGELGNDAQRTTTCSP